MYILGSAESLISTDKPKQLKREDFDGLLAL